MRDIHVEVEVKPLSYEVRIGTDILKEMTEELVKHPLGKRYAVITDSKVAELHGHRLMECLQNAGVKCWMFVFPEGEASKNRDMKEELEDAMLEAGFGRDCAVIALGGGVVGDLAGFVAATYMRGVPVLQIPTTTLSMADSAIGSKTAVDVPYGKNLIGAFHSPEAVYMDMQMLSTLDERNYYAGLVELIKHGFIRRPSLQEYLEEHKAVITAREGDTYAPVMEELFFQNSEVKNDVVSHDQKESNLRKILNYGHTLGHGVELVSDFELIHGECVAVGIAFAAFLAVELGYADESWEKTQVETLRAYHQACRIPENLSTDDILAAMKKDKKVRDGKIEFILLSGPGQIVQRENGDYGIPVEETV
ncbi:MAG: 3-dehydroquinate synthase, partial [Firmicutes bacterium]|nr:3-dehydroquinate synthase [Bacillota bacterium]